MTIVTGAAEQAPPRGPLAPMALAALGVVYGDIGTSPLYTFKTAIAWAGGEATPAAVLGMLSLIVWTLVITTSIKYVAIVMRADNDGEGGILALMSLLGIKHGERAGVIALGILGAASPPWRLPRLAWCTATSAQARSTRSRRQSRGRAARRRRRRRSACCR